MQLGEQECEFCQIRQRKKCCQQCLREYCGWGFCHSERHCTQNRQTTISHLVQNDIYRRLFVMSTPKLTRVDAEFLFAEISRHKTWNVNEPISISGTHPMVTLCQSGQRTLRHTMTKHPQFFVSTTEDSQLILDWVCAKENDFEDTEEEWVALLSKLHPKAYKTLWSSGLKLGCPVIMPLLRKAQHEKKGTILCALRKIFPWGLNIPESACVHPRCKKPTRMLSEPIFAFLTDHINVSKVIRECFVQYGSSLADQSLQKLICLHLF